ncbi:hypothetical protein QCA50_018529 [Cerrena zonata]|uniref:Uncharacterized protein n=1 Tax=Cerrena zonata TaxID=2478898 RepID=A0AAW0FHQ2_9APHY
MEISVTPYLDGEEQELHHSTIDDKTLSSIMYMHQLRQLFFRVELSLPPNTHARCTLLGQQRNILQRKIVSSGVYDMGLEKSIATNHVLLYGDYEDYSTTTPRARTLAAKSIIPYNSPGLATFTIEIDPIQIVRTDILGRATEFHPGPFNVVIPTSHSTQVTQHLGLDEEWSEKWLGFQRLFRYPQPSARVSIVVVLDSYNPFRLVENDGQTVVKQEEMD